MITCTATNTHIIDRAAIEDRLLLPPKQDTTAERG